MLLSHVWLFAIPWTAACQAPLSMGFSRQEFWSGLPCSSQRIFPTQGLNPRGFLHWGRFFSIWAPPNHLVLTKLQRPSQAARDSDSTALEWGPESCILIRTTHTAPHFPAQAVMMQRVPCITPKTLTYRYHENGSVFLRAEYFCGKHLNLLLMPTPVRTQTIWALESWTNLREVT